MRRLLPLRPARVALAGLAFVLLVAVGSPTAAQSSSSEPSLQLTLASQTNWVGPDGRFQVAVRADGVPTGATVRLAFFNSVRTREALDAAADGVPIGAGPIYQSQPKSVAESTSAEGLIVIDFDTAEAEFTQGGGLYPVQVWITDAGQKIIGRLTTTMVRLAPANASAGPPLSVGVIVPIEAPAPPGPDGDPRLSDEAAARLTSVIEAVHDQTQVQLTLSPSPESVLLLQERDETGGAAVEDLRTAASRNQVLSGAYVPIDSGAWLDSGLQLEMDQQYQQGTATLEDLLGSTTSPVAVLDRTVTPDVLTHLQDLGVSAAVSPTGQLAPLSNASATSAFAQQFRISTGEDRSIAAVAADDGAGNRLRPGGDRVLAAHQALAELAYRDQLQTTSGQRGIAVIVPADVDPLTLATFLAALAEPTGATSGNPGAAAVAPMTLNDLFRETAPPDGERAQERLYEADAPGDLGSYPDELRQGRQEYSGLVSFTPEADELHVPIDRRLLSSGSRGLDDDDRTAMVDGAIGSIQAATSEVVVTPEQIVTLTSSSGNVPLNLENRLPYRAEVRIQMASDKLDFPQGSVIQETLDPAHTTTIELPVETRATGAFPLTVTISSADGTLPVATTRYTVRSTAISGVGLVLSIGAGLFLLVWWARHWRTSRRAKTLVASTHPALSATEPDGYAPPDTDPLEGR